MDDAIDCGSALLASDYPRSLVFLLDGRIVFTFDAVHTRLEASVAVSGRR